MKYGVIRALIPTVTQIKPFVTSGRFGLKSIYMKTDMKPFGVIHSCPAASLLHCLLFLFLRFQTQFQVSVPITAASL